MTAQVDAILDAASPDHRALLQALRATIADAVPDAADAISYGMPAFRYRGRILVYYAAFKAHCSLFPASGAVIALFHDELGDFVTSKGTVQFTPEHPLPAELVARIVRARAAEIDAR